MIAVNRLEFLMPMRSPDIPEGESVAFSPYFQKYRFSVTGTIVTASRLPSGVQKIVASIGFSPEICDLLSDYFFAATIAARRA